MRRLFPALVLILSLVGLLVSAELTWVHYKVHTDPGHRSLCAVNAKMDCDAVAATPSATVFGVPNALWAALTYILLMALAQRARRQEREQAGREQTGRGPEADDGFPTAPRTLIFWAAVAIGGYTAWLIRVSFAELETFCLFCSFLWGVNGALLVLSLATASAASPVRGLARELSAARRRPLTFLSATVPVAAVAAAFVLLVPRLYPGAGPALADEVRLPADALPASAHVRGPADARHRIVVLSDYLCPYCRGANDAIERVRRLRPESVAVVHLHFPLEDVCNPMLDRAFHPGACRAAFAAECAGVEDRFWEMHDALFAGAPDWTDDLPLRLAADLGLDTEAFARCLESGDSARAAVSADVALGEHLEVNGTPMLYVDGREFLGVPTVPALLELVDE